MNKTSDFAHIQSLLTTVGKRAENNVVAPSRLEEPEIRLLSAHEMAATVQAALDRRERLIVWQWAGGEIGPVKEQLYAAARRGMWNHLILDAGGNAELELFAVANANIVHSYCYREKASSASTGAVFRFPEVSPAYGRTKPLTGRPLWMVVQDAARIRTLLAHYDRRTLMRLRVHDDGRRLFEVGKHMSYRYEAPEELPAGYLDEIVRMVEAGGSVNTRFVRHNLEKAYLIAYVEEEGVIVGNSSLKHPREEYIDAVSRQSGIDLHNYLERGYTSVRPEYRGLGVGAQLLGGLTERAGGYHIFSVIAENNIATQKMAMRNRTRRVAVFYSQRVEKEMGVWIPEWMLPEGIELPGQPELDIGGAGGKDAP